MVSPVAGYTAKVYIGATEIGGVTNVRLSDKNKMVEITALSDTARKSYPTIQDWTLSFDLVALDLTDAGQTALITAKNNKSTSTFKVTLNGSGTHYYSGSGYVESIDISIGADDVIKASVSIQPAGAMTYT